MEKRRPGINISLAVIALVATGFALIALESILMPLVVAFFLTMLFGPSMTFLTKRGTPTGLALLLVIVVAGIMIYLLGRVFYDEVPRLIEEFPTWKEKIHTNWEAIEAEFPEAVRAKLDLDWMAILPDKGFIASLLGNIFGVLSVFFIILVYMIFLLVERQQIMHRVTKAYGEEDGGRIIAAMEKIRSSMETYIVGKTLVSLATGLAFTVILWWFDVKFPVVWGMLAFLLNFVPYIGSFMATILPIVVAFGQLAHFKLSDDPAVLEFTYGQIAVLAGLLIAVQVTVGSFIEPRVFGQRLKISPLVVFLSFMLWGWMWGLPGIILSVPIMATIKIIMENVEPLKPVAILISTEGADIKKSKI